MHSDEECVAAVAAIIALVLKRKRKSKKIWRKRNTWVKRWLSKLQLEEEDKYYKCVCACACECACIHGVVCACIICAHVCIYIYILKL